MSPTKENAFFKPTLLQLPVELLREILIVCDPEDAFRLEKVLNRNSDSFYHQLIHSHMLDVQNSAHLIGLKKPMDVPPFKAGL